MKFALEIELGNDAMQDRFDVAGALERVSHTLAASPLPVDTQGIRDLNGATVGRWRFGGEPKARSPSDRVLDAMREIVNYNLPSEEADYERWREEDDAIDAPDNGHIVHQLRIADEYLGGIGL